MCEFPTERQKPMGTGSGTSAQDTRTLGIRYGWFSAASTEVGSTPPGKNPAQLATNLGSQPGIQFSMMD